MRMQLLLNTRHIGDPCSMPPNDVGRPGLGGGGVCSLPDSPTGGADSMTTATLEAHFTEATPLISLGPVASSSQTTPNLF